MPNRATRFLVCLIGVVLAAGVMPVEAAAPPTGLPVSLVPCDAQGNILSGPDYYVVTGHRGQTLHFYGLVGNVASRPADVHIVPVDARSDTQGGIGAALSWQRRSDVGAWIHLTTQQVRLGPKRAMIVPFSVHVPRQTWGGQHVGAITVFVPVTQSIRRRHLSLTVQTRLAVDVVVTVPGRRAWQLKPEGLQLAAQHAGVYAVAQIANSGSMLLKGWGYLWLWGSHHRHPIRSLPLTIGTLLPHSSIGYPLRLGNHLAPGRYSYALKLWWSGGKTMQRGNVVLRTHG